MQIAICDDDRAVCRQLRGWIEEYTKRERLEIHLMVFYSAEELLDSLSAGYWFDMVFQDIELPKKSGLDMAEELRRYVECHQVVIDFISGKQEYGMQLFDLQPINFRLKPLKRQEIEADLDKACRILKESKHALTYMLNNVQNGILLRDINYIESAAKMIQVYKINGEKIQFRGTLDRLEKEYGKYHFCRCHRAYIVNLHCVTAYHKGHLLLRGGKEIEVGSYYSANLKQQLSRLDFTEEML